MRALSPYLRQRRRCPVCASRLPDAYVCEGCATNVVRFDQFTEKQCVRGELELLFTDVSLGDGGTVGFARATTMTRVIRVAAKLTLFRWKYLDRYAIATLAALDAASAAQLIGWKSGAVSPGRALVASHRGAIT